MLSYYNIIYYLQEINYCKKKIKKILSNIEQQMTNQTHLLSERIHSKLLTTTLPLVNYPETHFFPQYPYYSRMHIPESTQKR
jgi:hypothetical protein